MSKCFGMDRSFAEPNYRTAKLRAIRDNKNSMFSKSMKIAYDRCRVNFKGKPAPKKIMARSLTTSNRRRSHE